MSFIILNLYISDIIISYLVLNINIFLIFLFIFIILRDRVGFVPGGLQMLALKNELSINIEQTHKIEEFINEVHGENGTSYITVCAMNGKKFTHRHYKGPVNTINAIVNAATEQNDVYYSVSSYHTVKRGLATLFTLNALYVDIDAHGNTFDYDRVMYYLENEFFDISIPTPTHIVHTGRGLHLYWNIKSAPRHALPTWCLIRDRIMTELAHINKYVPGVTLDKNCADPTRILRVPYTYNTKAHLTARMPFKSGYEYTLAEIRENYYPDLYPEVKKPTKRAADPKTLPKNTTMLFTQLSLLMARMDDLEKLIELRDADFCGLRSELLFIYAWTCVNKGISEEDFIREVLAINSLFKKPLPDGEAKTKAKHIYKKYKSGVLKKDKPVEYYEYYDRYIFRNETIIKRLEITEDEQRQLKTIISKDEKYRRNNLRRRTPRDTDGLTAKQREVKKRVEDVKTLKAKGYTIQEIADTLGIGKTRVKQLLK